MNYRTLLNRDCKSYYPRRKRPLQRRPVQLLIGVSALAGVVALLNPSGDAEATRSVAPAQSAAATTVANEQVTLALTLPQNGGVPQGIGASTIEPPPQPITAPSHPAEPVTAELAVPAIAPEKAQAVSVAETTPKAQAQPAAPVHHWQNVTVHRGDTLSGLFKKVGLSATTLFKVMNSGDEAARLKRLMPGQTLKFDAGSGQLRALHYTIDATKTLEIAASDDGFTSTLATKPVENRLSYSAGVIDSSLYVSAQQAGLPDGLIMELAGIFGWDVDFALDIRHGDSFSVLYEDHYVDGEKLDDGPILAAEFVNRGNVYRAVRFTDPSGRSNYYTPEGLSMRKAFLRSPVDFRRISSKFQAERFHPVLGRKRPHRGVDYAAAIGTPIKASGDGKVVFRGWKGGYGRVVILQHGSTYSTLYAHMSKFQGNVKVGSRVRQGQTIGYVGMSGLATGPHLHYEFRVNGVHRNPLTVKLPNAAPIAAKYKKAFLSEARQLLAKLDLHGETQLARNNH